MGEAKPTKGEWVFCGEGDWTISVDGESVMGDTTYYPWVPSNKADWLLFVDAGNTYNTTGLTPSQLVERVKELEAVVSALITYDADSQIEDGVLMMLEYAELLKAARAVLSKARPNTAEGEAHSGSVLEDAARRWTAPKYDPKQREWCIAYETETGFDPMMDDYEAGLQTFAEAAVASLRWYEDHTRDTHLRISSKTIPGGPYDAARAQQGGKA